MYATKEAVMPVNIAKKWKRPFLYRYPGFWERIRSICREAKHDYGVRYIKSRIANVTELHDGSLKLPMKMILETPS